MKASKKPLSSSAAVQRDAYNLPSHNALAHILSDHRTKGKHEQNERTKTQHGIKPNPKHTYQTLLHPPKRCSRCDCECAPCSAGFTDLQTEELESCRSAMTRMADDIIALRSRVMTLETQNVQLRAAHASPHKDVGRGLLEDTDVDVMTKAEMADRIATLRLKLSNETNTTSAQRDRIQQLQNQLIRKNELLKLQKDPRSELEKTASSEETVKQKEKQEKVSTHQPENLKVGSRIQTQRKQKEDLHADPGSKKKHGLLRTSTTILHSGPGVAS